MTTPRGAPELVSAQALPETTVNEQVRFTEAGACHFVVADNDLTAPPGACADGANYIIASVATGLWAGKENQIATAVGTNAASGWLYHVPVEGFTAYIQDENARHLFDGAAWVVDTTGGSFSTASTTEVLTGTDSAKGVTPDSLAALWEQGADVASAGTISLGEGGYFNVTGTTTITDIDFATDKAGRAAWVKFAGILTLTHNASTLILPTGASITTAAGDTALFISEGADAVRCASYQRASGAALVSSGGGGAVADVQEFTANGTWTKPSGSPQFVRVICIGGGGGGGGAAGGDNTANRAGGGGGAGGAMSVGAFLAASLAATVAVTVGAAGGGGAGGTGGSGTTGTAGGTSSFGSHITAKGGSNGTGGSTAGGSAGPDTGTQGALHRGNAGAAGAVTAGSTAPAITAAGYGGGGGGGGGGGVTTSDGTNGGGAGSQPIQHNGGNTAGGGGTAGANPGGAGGAGTSTDIAFMPGYGGGGGGGTTGAVGGGGGAGGYGGGGGGGGAGRTTGGAGGAGGPGRVWVITSF